MDNTKLKSLLVLIETTIKQAIQRLNEKGGKILFVTDEHGKLIGTLTDGDIRRGLMKGYGFNDRIESIMKKDFLHVKAGLSNMREHIKETMLTTKIEHIPVLDKDGCINDVISWTDLLSDEKRRQPVSKFENHVVIMAGGKGTRLDPFTKILPKPLIPIGDKPIIERIMEKFYQSGFHRFIYTLNYKKEYMKLFLRDEAFPYDIDWVEEDEFLGTVGSLSLLADKLDDTFFVVNCDSLLDVNFEEIYKWHKEHKAAMTIVGCHNEVRIPFGVLQVNNGRLQEIVEKPVHDIMVNTGLYVIEPHIISYIKAGEKMDVNELMDLIVEKEKIIVYPIYNGWFDVGQWEEYKKSIERLNA